MKQGTLTYLASLPALLACGVMNMPVDAAQTFNVLHNFCNEANCADGSFPSAGLIQSTGGNFFGTTQGLSNSEQPGTVFKMSFSGSLTTVYTFCSQPGCADGVDPRWRLLQASNGDFYGATAATGGDRGIATLFGLTSSGALTTYSFCEQGGCNNGLGPNGGLIQGLDGDLFGVTPRGGAYGFGTLFKLTPDLAFSTVHSFGGAGNSGRAPEGTLFQASNGNLYGTTVSGGETGSGAGTVFQMTSTAVTTLYGFCTQPECSDGSLPDMGVIQGSDGNLYGTTSGGGASSAGTIFRLTLGGVLSTLYSFPSGSYPGALIQATDGNFYGITGNVSDGTAAGSVFRMTPAGAVTTLHTFCSQANCADGSNPQGVLLQATNGRLYGVTAHGGKSGHGLVFSLNLGLEPFVALKRAAGDVGATVTLIGTDLAGTTGVTFNGTATTSFTVNSTGTAITATVPTGATSGPVQVITPDGTLKSNVSFTVN